VKYKIQVAPPAPDPCAMRCGPYQGVEWALRGCCARLAGETRPVRSAPTLSPQATSCGALRSAIAPLYAGCDALDSSDVGCGEARTASFASFAASIRPIYFPPHNTGKLECGQSATGHTCTGGMREAIFRQGSFGLLGLPPPRAMRFVPHRILRAVRPNQTSPTGLVQQTVQIVASHDLTLFVSHQHWDFGDRKANSVLNLIAGKERQHCQIRFCTP